MKVAGFPTIDGRNNGRYPTLFAGWLATVVGGIMMFTGVKALLPQDWAPWILILIGIIVSMAGAYWLKIK